MGVLTSTSWNGNSGERGWGGEEGTKAKVPSVRDMDIFWNYTLSYIHILSRLRLYVVLYFISYPLAGSELKMGVAHPNHPFIRFSLGADRKRTPLFFPVLPSLSSSPPPYHPQQILTAVNKTCLQNFKLVSSNYQLT